MQPSPTWTETPSLLPPIATPVCAGFRDGHALLRLVRRQKLGIDPALHAGVLDLDPVPPRLVAVNCVPLGAVPRTGAFLEGADLMFTPGRCKKTRSGGVTALGATWGVSSAVSEAEHRGKEPHRMLREMAQAQ